MTTCEKLSQCVVVFDGRYCPLCEAVEEIKAITALRQLRVWGMQPSCPARTGTVLLYGGSMRMGSGS